MNEYNNESNRGPVTPYKASGNLNTAIGNPQVNINDTMNVNIQSMATNSTPIANPLATNIVEKPQINNINTNTGISPQEHSVQNMQNTQANAIKEPHIDNAQTKKIEEIRVELPKQNPTPVYTNKNTNIEVTNKENNTGVQRTYITTNNQAKKKTLSLSLGPEFKIGLLIIVILLVFVLFLPMISDFINGY